MTLAGRELEDCRRRLVFLFLAKGAGDASQDLASEAILRVVRNANSGENIASLPAYALGVGRLVLQEFWREKNRQRVVDVDVNQLKLAAPEPETAAEQRHACLEKCRRKLSHTEHALLRAFYWERRGGAELASRMGISAVAVLIRLHRIRKGLKRCMERCVEAWETG